MGESFAVESEIIIATLKNRVGELEAKLLDKSKEIEDLRGICQDLLVAAGELVKKHGSS